jgi:hypothetical protein
MAQRITPEDARTWFAEHMKGRREYGFGNAILNLVLDPRNPFNVKSRRELKPGFLFAIVWLGAAVALFALFNCLLGRS